MKVLLISPPVTYHKEDLSMPSKSPLLGLTYIAAAIREAGHEVKILDCFTSSTKYFHIGSNFIRYSLSDDEILVQIKQVSPDVVGVSSMYTSSCQDAHNVARIVKEFNPAILVVFGGNHATILTERVLKDENVDLVVMGEGEITIREVLERFQKNTDFIGVSGIVHRLNGELVWEEPRKPANMDDLPRPARDLIKEGLKIMNYELRDNKYIMRKPVAHIQTSRGCPNNCYFCSFTHAFGRKWRARSAKNVVDEIEHLVKDCGYREIHFVDDNSSVSSNRMRSICDEILRRQLDIKIATPSGIAVNTLDKELLKKMKEAGFYRLCFGIETGDPESQKRIGKKVDLQHTKDIIREANKLGFWTAGTFIIGHPHENMDGIRATINYAKESNLDFAVFAILVPQLGTRAYEIVKMQGLIDYDPSFCDPNSEDFYKISIAYFKGSHTSYCSNEELHKIRSLAYKKFIIQKFCNSRTYINLCAKIKNLEDLVYVLGLGTIPVKMLFDIFRGKEGHYLPSRKVKNLMR